MHLPWSLFVFLLTPQPPSIHQSQARTSVSSSGHHNHSPSYLSEGKIFLPLLLIFRNTQKNYSSCFSSTPKTARDRQPTPNMGVADAPHFRKTACPRPVLSASPSPLPHLSSGLMGSELSHLSLLRSQTSPFFSEKSFLRLPTTTTPGEKSP